MKTMIVTEGNILEAASLVHRQTAPSATIQADVARIINTVMENGDQAIREWTYKLDGVYLDEPRVRADEIAEAIQAVGEDYIKLLQRACAQIRTFHEKQRPTQWQLKGPEGSVVGQLVRPLGAVGLYIPGGKAAYPSTVLMNVIPAQVAQVKRIALFTPPNQDGAVNPSVLAAASVLGVDEIYKIGGAQAIAAAAYGTETIAPVNKITGPGNIYVATAKQQVFGQVAIDMIAGPSEVLIIADASANPVYIAADLLAQGEHDEQAAMILITTDPSLPEKVQQEIDRQLPVLDKRSILKESLSNQLWSFTVDSLETAAKLSDAIAPEHLELLVRAPQTFMHRIQNASAIFLGPWSPEALGDYYAGPNHTLPTSGSAKYASPLGVYDFIKRPTFIDYTQGGLQQVADDVMGFAQSEGLTAHKNAITVRCRP